MSKKTLTVIASYVFILLITVFTGCQNLTSFNLNGTFENPDSEITKNETPFLTFNFYGGNEKTVNPVFDCSKLTAITLKGTVTDGVEETLFTEKTYAEITGAGFSVPLAKEGTYSFVMTAKLNERNYSCSLSNIEIKNGKNALSFSMSFINQDENFVPGNGNIQINLKVKNHSDIKYAKVSLLKNDGTSAYGEEKIDNTGNGIFTFSKSNVPAGNYIVKYSFYNGENLLGGYYMENVNVSKDLTSLAIREVEAVAQYYKINYALNGGSWVEGYEGAGVYSKYGISSLPAWNKAFKGNDGVAGWYYDESYIEKATDENIKIKTGDITLYPKYDLIASSDGFGDLINRIKTSGVTETRQIKILDADPDLGKIADALKDENVKVGIDLSGCTELKSLPGNCFMNCISLTKITISEEIIAIGTYAFNNCSSLESINLPKGITVIEEFTFNGCSKLNNIVIPNGVTTIGTAAFENCTSLTEIKIPVSVVSIGEDEIEFMAYWTFIGCSSLTKVTAPCRFKNNENFKNCFGDQYSKISFEYEHTYTGENITCDCGVEKTDCEEGPCGTDAKFNFVYKTGILTITGSGDVTVNNFSAFASEIKSVKIDDTITGVYPGMFTAFTSLKEVNAPCTAIKNAGLNESKVTVISHHIYGKYNDEHCICGKSTQKKYERNWGGSIKCTYYDGSKVALFTGSGILSDEPPDIFAGTQDPDYIYYHEIVKAETVEICDGITGIGYKAFPGKNWKNMKVLKMADSVISIGGEAFSNLPLTKITLSKFLDTIDNNAFSGCSSLENLVIPDSVRILGSEVFMNCSNLKTIHIGNGIKAGKMVGDIFEGCPSDAQITAPGKLNGNSCLNGFTNITWY